MLRAGNALTYLLDFKKRSGAMLSEKRHLRRLSITEVARRSGLSEGQVYKVEDGHGTLINIASLAWEFGLVLELVEKQT